VFLSLNRFPENVFKRHDFNEEKLYFEAADFVDSVCVMQNSNTIFRRLKSYGNWNC
jgi:hypothetical protein